MKKIQILFFCLISGLFAFANTGELEIRSDINEVIVFRQGAQVERDAQVNIPAGNSIIKFTGISPTINKQSIQVSATGAFTILSVVHQLNYFEEPVENEQTREWRQQLEELYVLTARTPPLRMFRARWPKTVRSTSYLMQPWTA